MLESMKEDSSATAIGIRVLGLRKAANLDQQEVAETTGVKLSNIQAIEAGRSRPGVDVLRALMGLFGVTADFVLYGFHEGLSASKWKEVKPHIEAAHQYRTSRNRLK